MAFLFVTLSRTVTSSQLALESEKSATNPSLTLGYEIPVTAELSEQLATARVLAAKKAASLPRGANMRIGRLGHTNLRTAGEAIEEDPFTAVKIAAFHTWPGAKSGPPVGGAQTQVAATRQATAAAPASLKRPEDLVPGVDYPFIEVTDDMGADEVRRARIANARARSAAVKALKEQATGAPAPAAAPGDGAAAAAPAAPAAPATSAAPTAAAAGIEEPDYIEITDDMGADEVRKARIHNARARSAYMKSLKAAGVDPSQSGEEAAPAAAPAGASAEAVTARETTAEAATEPAATAAAEAAATEAAGSAAAESGAVEIPAHIARPEYIEITDDMSPDEVRHARVNNSRERSRFFKALKDAGIDPKSVADSV